MLDKRNRWTSGEDDLIRSIYPNVGMKATYDELCKVFGERHPWESFRTRIYDLHLNVTHERWEEACKNNGTRTNVPVGTVVKRGRGENWIKVADGTDGWIPLKRHLLGEQGKGMNIVHLDGDKANDDIDNLMAVNREVCALMARNGFWSENREVTRTGIMWCELVQAMKGAQYE